MFLVTGTLGSALNTKKHPDHKIRGNGYLNRKLAPYK